MFWMVSEQEVFLWKHHIRKPLKFITAFLPTMNLKTWLRSEGWIKITGCLCLKAAFFIWAINCSNSIAHLSGVLLAPLRSVYFLPANSPPLFTNLWWQKIHCRLRAAPPHAGAIGQRQQYLKYFYTFYK